MSNDIGYVRGTQIFEPLTNRFWLFSTVLSHQFHKSYICFYILPQYSTVVVLSHQFHRISYNFKDYFSSCYAGFGEIFFDG